MIRSTVTHRKNTTTARTAAKVAIAGMLVGAPLAIFAGSASAAPATTGNNWDAVAQCESGGNWSTNTGNGFSGGLQFTPSTWQAYGGTGSPQGASKAQQVQVAEKVLAGQGKGAWPVCGKALGSANTSSSAGSSASGSTPKATTKSAPKASVSATPRADAPKATTKSAPKASVGTTPKAGADYVVKSGDTLSSVAQANGIEGGYQALFTLNQGTIQDPNLILVGQQLALR
ncbi:MAG: transglycosylase family protein [Mycobacteriaceae bacterium]